MPTGQLTEGEIEQEIQNLGLNKGLRLTPQIIDALIKGTHYTVVPGTTTTICALVLLNDFVVVGKAACVEPANFNEELGKKIAFDDARNQIWMLEGYLLASIRHHQANCPAETEQGHA